MIPGRIMLDPGGFPRMRPRCACSFRQNKPNCGGRGGFCRTNPIGHDGGRTKPERPRNPMKPQIDPMRAPDTEANRARNLGFFFDAAVRALPDKIAVIDLHGGRERQITYRTLDARMDRVAAMLAGLGARPGERIGMLIGNRVEFLEVFFGAMRMGAIPVILNTRLAADTLTAI